MQPDATSKPHALPEPDSVPVQLNTKPTSLISLCLTCASFLTDTQSTAQCSAQRIAECRRRTAIKGNVQRRGLGQARQNAKRHPSLSMTTHVANTCCFVP